MTDGDPHHREQRLKNTIESIENSDQISEHNTEVALDFKKYLESQGLSLDRISRYFYSLKFVLRHIDWKIDEPTKDDLIELVGDINQDKLWDGERAEATKAEYKKLVRKLYKDYLDAKREDFDGEGLTDFFTVTVKKNFVDPEELPRPRDVAELVQNCYRTRDKAFIMTIWSTSARISAVLGLRWKDVRFDSDIATIKFRDTKTGDDRKVPVASAYPYLKELKEKDSEGDNPEAYVFRPLDSKPDNQLNYKSARGIVERARKRSSIPDHIRTNFHAFRKGKITDLARRGWGEAQISRMSGHIVGSEEIRVYCRLASEDITSAVKRTAGLQQEENEEEDRNPLRPLKCHDCGFLNKWECENCSRCGEVLTTSELFKEIKTQEQEEEIRKELVDRQTDWDNEKVSQKAKKIVEKELNRS